MATHRSTKPKCADTLQTRATALLEIIASSLTEKPNSKSRIPTLSPKAMEAEEALQEEEEADSTTTWVTATKVAEADSDSSPSHTKILVSPILQ